MISGRIAVSEAARRTLVEHLGGDAVLIPNGVRLAAFADAEPLPGRGGAAGQSGETIGFLGRIDGPRKGFPVLLEGFKLLAERRPGLRLLVAGPGDADEVRKVLPAALRPRVSLLGTVSDADKARMLRSVDLFVAPNTGGESFGIVLLEAMAAGAPVLASDIEAFRVVLQDGRSGALFRTGDGASLAEVAGRLLDDAAARAALAVGGQARVRQYDWSNVAREVVRVYETVALDTALSPRGR
jgi:phosphatidylinositol alpha-mannosyltransferase